MKRTRERQEERSFKAKRKQTNRIDEKAANQQKLIIQSNQYIYGTAACKMRTTHKCAEHNVV